MYVFKLIVQL